MILVHFKLTNLYNQQNRAFNISDLVINAGFVFLVAACLSSSPFDEEDDESLAPTSADPSIEPSVEQSKE